MLTADVDRVTSSFSCFAVDTNGFLVYHEDFIQPDIRRLEFVHITEKVFSVFGTKIIHIEHDIPIHFVYLNADISTHTRTHAHT